MALVRWNRPFPSIFDEDLWPQVSWRDVTDSTGIDIYETDDAVVAQAQVPGIPEDQVEVTVEGNVLTISGSYEETQEEQEKKRTVYKQTRQTSFNYTTGLPRMVDAAKAQAEVENGVVKVTIPKVEEEKPKKIEVKKKEKAKE